MGASPRETPRFFCGKNRGQALFFHKKNNPAPFFCGRLKQVYKDRATTKKRLARGVALPRGFLPKPWFVSDSELYTFLATVTWNVTSEKMRIDFDLVYLRTVGFAYVYRLFAEFRAFKLASFRTFFIFDYRV